MKPSIYDEHENGISIGFDFENGMEIKIYMTDDNAQNFIDIIQNKLNARIRL